MNRRYAEGLLLIAVGALMWASCGKQSEYEKYPYQVRSEIVNKSNHRVGVEGIKLEWSNLYGGNVDANSFRDKEGVFFLDRYRSKNSDALAFDLSNLFADTVTLVFDDSLRVKHYAAQGDLTGVPHERNLWSYDSWTVDRRNGDYRLASYTITEEDYLTAMFAAGRDTTDRHAYKK